MLTTFDQVQEWITENGFQRWVLYKDSSKTEKILDSASFTVSDQADKLAMTEKYLRLAGGRAYAAGAPSKATSDLSTTCEIRLQEQPTSGVGGSEPFNIGELTRSITESVTKQVRAEMEAEKYKDERAAFERERKEFEEEKKSTLGALVHYFAPIGQQLMARHTMPKVAGVDSDAPVHVAPIIPAKPENEPRTEEPEQEQDDFTDEESTELYTLLVRFKKVEPNYLAMLRKVVAMAESGDATYTMAKGFLVG